MPSMLAASAADMADPASLDLETPHGRARAHVHPAAGEAHGALLLGHGAGGQVTAPDLQAVAQAAGERGVTAVLVEQPYRVAGRRTAPAAATLDVAWTAVVQQLAADVLAGLPLVVGGRSSGARVACRTATALDAVGVLCLAFPLRPPQPDPARERKDRSDELRLPEVPVLVVQGRTDRFEVPDAAPGREVVVVEGDHALKRDPGAVASAAGAWLDRVLRP